MTDVLPSFMKDAIPANDSGATSAPEAPLPSFMKDAIPANDAAPVTSMPSGKAANDAEYGQNLVKLLADGGTKQQAIDYAKANGKELKNIDEVIDYRDNHNGSVSSRIVNDLPDDSQRSGVRNFIEGAANAPLKLEHGLAQLLIRGGNALGLVSDVDANMAQAKLGNDSQESDAIHVRGKAGPVGEFAGDLATTAALPLGRVVKGGKALSTALTVGKRALVGGAASEVNGASSTQQQQDQKGIIGAVTTPLAIPVAEKIFGAIGNKLGNAYLQIAGNGVGKTLYDASGKLTTYGNVLRARLKSVNRDLPDQLIDDTLKQIALVNPKVLPADKAIVPSMLADKEAVPLTGAMKSRNNKGIQDFEGMQTGSVGNKAGQQQATDRSKQIDDAIVNNIKSVGNGTSSSEASTNTSSLLTKGYDAGKAEVDRLYAPLNTIKIKAPKEVAGIATQARSEFGAGGYSTLGTTARGYIDRINGIAETPQPLFGDLWKLSKDVNEDLRSATGNDRYQLGIIKKSIDSYFTKAANSGSGGIDEVAAQQLKLANAANRQFSKKFGENTVSINAGRTKLPDRAGKAIGNIINMAKDATDRGQDINPALVENAIFGQGKALDSAGAKQAAINVQRLVKAVPETAPHVKDMVVNRMVGQITDGLYGGALKPGTAQTVIKGAVENNRALLKAAGLTDSDITRLQTNAYLASLKVPDVGARQRGSSATVRGQAAKVAGIAFRRALSAALGYGGAASVGPVGALAYPASEAALAGAKAIGESHLAAKTLSDKVPLTDNPAGKKAGKWVGSLLGATTATKQGN